MRRRSRNIALQLCAALSRKNRACSPRAAARALREGLMNTIPDFWLFEARADDVRGGALRDPPPHDKSTAALATTAIPVTARIAKR